MVKRKPTLVLISVFALMVGGMTLPVMADHHKAMPEQADQESEQQKAQSQHEEDNDNATDSQLRDIPRQPENRPAIIDKYTDSKLRDAWLDGKLELAYALNAQLNPFTIDTEVKDGVVHLTGTVESEIDKALATELAMGIEGIDEVNNNLLIDKEAASAQAQEGDMADDAERSFGRWFDDVTITAMVKTRLLANDNTSGLDINVDTSHGVVTLSGTVASEAEKALAGQLAENTEGVIDVTNVLEVTSG